MLLLLLLDFSAGGGGGGGPLNRHAEMLWVALASFLFVESNSDIYAVAWDFVLQGATCARKVDLLVVRGSDWVQRGGGIGGDGRKSEGGKLEGSNRILLVLLWDAADEEEIMVGTDLFCS